jgi:hypothetical protein
MSQKPGAVASLAKTIGFWTRKEHFHRKAAKTAKFLYSFFCAPLGAAFAYS